MKYTLNYKDTIDKSLLFWIEIYIRNKITNLSNRHIKDSDKLSLILQKLNSGTSDIEELKTLIKECRNIGLNGIATYFNPIYKLYNYILPLKLLNLKQIDEDILSDFLATTTSSLSDATKKNHKIAIVNFFSYIDKKNVTDDMVKDENNAYLYNIELTNWGGLRGKSGSKLPSFMNEKEIHNFLDSLNNYPFSSKISARNKLIIKIIIYTGIRVSEALGLNMKDLFQEKDIFLIQIKGKGNKPRVVMIKVNIIHKELNEWLDLRQSDTNLLLCNAKGKALTQSYISRVVEKVLINAGIRKEKNGAHMLRHSFATLLYNKHHDLVLVQEALGHSDINTSRIYTHFDTKKLQRTTNLIS
jgi:integrase/recombinase XerD